MNSRTHQQGGWVATFVIVGAVLLAGLLGGIYYLRTHTKQQVAQETSESTKKEQSDDKSDASDDSASSEEEVSPPATEEETPLQENATETPNPELPVTGPTTDFVRVIGAVLLTTSFVGYVRSR